MVTFVRPSQWWKSLKSRSKILILILLVVILPPLGVSSYILLIERPYQITEVIEDIYSIQRGLARQFATEINGSLSEVLLLAKSQPIERLVTVNRSEYGNALQAVELLFLNYGTHLDRIVQVRYINSSGYEIVRVNVTIDRDQNEGDSGTAILVQQDQLQYNGSRTYFTETKKLSIGKVYISDIELNRESGEIHTLENGEYMPVIRIASPVFNGTSFAGIVILNINVQPLLDRFNTTFREPFANPRLLLVESSGHFTYNPKGDEWSSTSNLDSGSTLFTEFSKIPLTFLTQNHDKFEIEGKVIIQDRIGIPFSSSDYSLHLVSITSLGSITETIDRELAIVFFILTLGVFLTGLIAMGFIALDITELRRVEREVTRSNYNYQTLVNNSEVGILIVNGITGEIIFNNPLVTRILGFSPDQLAEIRFFDILISEDVDRIKEFFQMRLLKGNQETLFVEDCEFQIRNGDGHILWIRMKTAVTATKKKSSEIQCYFWDITKEKEYQELRDLFIATTSHELRTPITVIDGWVDFIQRIPVDELTSEQWILFYTNLKRNTHRLMRLITNVHDLSKIQENFFTISRNNFNCEKFVEVLQDQIRLLYPTRHVLINYCESPNITNALYLDQDRILQVCNNLVSNAIKNSSPESLIEITVSRNASEFLIQVEDQGAGITSDGLFQLFQPFSHKPSKFSTIGTGLGLYITKAIVQAHGGTLSLYTRENIGTTFLVAIPNRESSDE